MLAGCLKEDGFNAMFVMEGRSLGVDLLYQSIVSTESDAVDTRRS